MRSAAVQRRGCCRGGSLWVLGLGLRRPLHQGAPSPLEWAAWGSLRCRAQGGRLQLQPTRRTPAEKGEGMAGAVEEKPTKDASPSPSPSLWSSNSLILNLRLTSPPTPLLIRFSPLRHMHSSCSCHWLPSSSHRAMNGQIGTKPSSSALRKSHRWVLNTERCIYLTLSWFRPLRTACFFTL